MAVYQAEADVDHTAFLDTAANDGQAGYGDGVAVAGASASLTLTDVLVQGNARAGVVTHGAAAALTRVVLECNTIDIDAEPYKGAAAALDDRGGNFCGCAGEQRPCKVSSAGLTPPGGLGE
jgi:hypothetical protein